MQTVYVTFASDNATIIAAYAVQQAALADEIEVDDPRWKTYFDALPTGAQEGWPSPVTVP